MEQHNDSNGKPRREGSRPQGRPQGGRGRSGGPARGSGGRRGDRRFSSDGNRRSDGHSQGPKGRPDGGRKRSSRPEGGFDRSKRSGDGFDRKRKTYDGKRSSHDDGRRRSDFDRARSDRGPKRSGGKHRDDHAPRRDGNHAPRPKRNTKAPRDRVASAVVKQQGSGFKGFANERDKSEKRSVRLTAARSIALAALSEVREQGCYLAEALSHALASHDASKRDRAFARLLATEATARLGSLDELIDSVLDGPDDIGPEVRDALRLSFCELFYLGKEDYVVVDQGVELVRSVEPRAVRLANNVLHRALDAKPEFPFGDPATDDHAASLAFGFPLWLVQRLVEELGRESALRFMERANKPAPLYFMLNVARVDGAQTLESLVSSGLRVVPAEPVMGAQPAFPLFVFAERTLVGNPRVEALLKDGGLVVSDLAAQSVALLALPEGKPARFLEIGAGRGTKSILLQNAALARYGSQMKLDTLDSSAPRTEERTARLKRARIKEEQAYLKDATDLSDLPEGSYDAVFVDAPCSGVGTLRRHPDIRWRASADGITSLASVGASILAQAARMVAPGGRLTYATCTVFSEENDAVIDGFLASEAGQGFECVLRASSVEDACADTTGPTPDAHYVCVLRRRE